MDKSIYRLVGTLGLLVCFAGCSDSVATDPEQPHGEWTALEDLQFNALMNIGQDASRGNWGVVRAEASKDSFQQAVEEFDKAPLPDNLKEHESLKADIVQSLRDLIAAAKAGGGPEQMKSAWEETQAAIAAMKEKQHAQ